MNDDEFGEQYEFDQDSDYAKQCSVMDESSWPTAHQMSLNEFQYEAVKLALTNKLALIQG